MKDLNKVTIDGVELDVVAREKAVIDESMSGISAAVGTQMRTVDRLLLANERIIFQCMHPGDDDCTYIADVVRSVTAHQRSHSGRAVRQQLEEKLAEAETARLAIEQELAERKQRRSEGSKKAAETRRQQRGDDFTKAPVRAHVPAEAGGNGSVNAPGVVGDRELAAAAQRVITAFNAMQDAADEFQKVLIGYLRLAQTVTSKPPVDPDVLEKARKFDEFQRLLGK